ncbi:MAG: hypothetical protein A2X80_11680 [Geobacteraceae bacterium GWB2_52_12]|nr:MAG: hypothetical protein A2X80_11680 [Geobacteraceae bacterium GWB2_52_12]
MFGIGTPELVIILGIMLVIFGPSRLPQLGSSLGGAIRGFRNAADEEPKVINLKGEEEKIESCPGHNQENGSNVSSKGL